jgi:hypothetical protein
VYELTDNGIFSLTSLLLPGSATSSSPPNCFALKVNAKVRGEAGELPLEHRRNKRRHLWTA